jgi:hypothetical protein
MPEVLQWNNPKYVVVEDWGDVYRYLSKHPFQPKTENPSCERKERVFVWRLGQCLYQYLASSVFLQNWEYRDLAIVCINSHEMILIFTEWKGFQLCSPRFPSTQTCIRPSTTRSPTKKTMADLTTTNTITSINIPDGGSDHHKRLHKHQNPTPTSRSTKI